jgi:uncharacterized protein (TIGR02284 family)
MARETVVDTLNDLIRITEDSHEGYRKSAEDVDDPVLKEVFNDLAAQRGAMVRELQKLVAEQGGAPESSGTVLGGAHRVLIDLKAAVLGRDRHAILAEVERGESEAVRRYEQALQTGLPQPLHDAVTAHLDRIRLDRDRVMRLDRTAG